MSDVIKTFDLHIEEDLDRKILVNINSIGFTNYEIIGALDCVKSDVKDSMSEGTESVKIEVTKTYNNKKVERTSIINVSEVEPND